MNSRIGIGLPWFVILLAILFLIVWRMYAGKGISYHRPRSLGRGIRWIAGLCGAGLFGTVIVSTILDTPGGQIPMPVTPVTMPIANRSLEPYKGDELPMIAVETPARLLIHVIAFRSFDTILFPVHAESFEFSWPKEKAVEKDREFSIGPTEIRLRVNPTFLWSKKPETQSGPTSRTLDVSGFLTGEMRSGDRVMHFTTFLGDLTGKASNPFVVVPPSKQWFSQAAIPPDEVALYLWGQLAPVDAKTREVRIDDFVEEHLAPGSIGGRKLYETSDFHIFSFWNPSFSRNTPMPGWGLLVSKGFGLVALLAGAWLLSLLAPRRSLTVAGWMLAAVLLTVVLDRTTLIRDLARARNPSGNTLLRAEACQRAGTTFFYQPTAAKALQRLADTKEDDIDVRAIASKTAMDLTEKPWSRPPLEYRVAPATPAEAPPERR